MGHSASTPLTLGDRYACWPALEQHSREMEGVRITSLFASNSRRAQQFSIEAAGLHLDYSKHPVTEKTIQLFSQLAAESSLGNAIRNLLEGACVNTTENRPAWHTALRAEHPPHEVTKTLERMLQLVDDIHSGYRQGFSKKAFTDVVNIGIGGSDLGPRMATFALAPFHQKSLRCHFVSNVDPSDIDETLAALNPETTLFVIASKSFTTLETMINAGRAKSWLLAAAGKQDVSTHFVAVSTAIDRASHFGIKPDNVFPLWDWVGGRYSLWSAIGLPIALAIGMKEFGLLLHGAMRMDKHFEEASAERNMPVIMALLGIWHSQFYHTQSHVVLPYAHHLRYLPDFLQQLEMESSGKAVDRLGNEIDYPTGSILWGAAGTIGQHSFHQLLHQGTHRIPADFILPLRPAATCLPADIEQHRHLVANCLGQSQAMLEGRTASQVRDELQKQGLATQDIESLVAHKVIVGNNPHSIISFDELNAETLGALIALYEHKVYVQSVIWQTNAFDQWGVELGKALSKPIFDALSEKAPASFDASTDQLVTRYLKARCNP